MRARDLLELMGDAAFGVRLGELVDAEREPLGEPPVVDEDDRRAVRADELEQRRVDRGPDRADVRLVARSPSPLRPAPPAATAGCGRSSSRMSSTGITTSRSSSLRWPASTSVISRPVPATNRPISASGRCVADSPIRWNGRSTTRSSRSSETERCVPRFVPATACTSSRISVSTLRRISRPCEVRSRNSDSGVVMRTSGGVRSIRCRSRCGVSPVRTPTVELRAEPGERPAEVPLDVVVERLQRRDVEEPQALARRLVQPVDALEERGERLPRARRRLHEDVRPGRDRGPGEFLRGRRAGEGTLEPGSRRGRQRCERIHASSVALGRGLGPTASRTAVDRPLA